ncbi:MAG: hypothetical protein K8R54_02925 [Bacteroidales bacterium]|nr:hypothetical protein [Bacteroidales bacterium]
MKQSILIFFITVYNLSGYSQHNFLNTEPSWSHDGEKIVFISKRDKNNEVYIMNNDGSLQIRLTNTLASESVPSFSPDGKEIIFHSDRTGVIQIFKMNIDGTNQINLTKTKLPETNGTWSPSGKEIAFTSVRDDNAQVYIMNSNGSNQKRIVKTETNVSNRKWSNEESVIACLSFDMFKDIKEYIQVDISDKTFKKIFKDTIENYGFHDWSKDLSNVIYVKSKMFSYTESYSELYISNINFENPEKVFKINDRIITAKFSPNEDKILIYTSHKVYVLLLESGKVVKVGKNHHSPQWSPDGKSIVMVSSPMMNIYTVNPDGTNLKQLTFKKRKKKNKR